MNDITPLSAFSNRDFSFVEIPLGEGRGIVWCMTWPEHRRKVGSLDRLLRRSLSRAGEVVGIVVDLSRVNAADFLPLRRLSRVSAELESRGILLIIVGATADVLTCLRMDGEFPRLAFSKDLSSAIYLMRRSANVLRLRSGAAGAAHTWRLPARLESVATLCRALGIHLREAGISESVMIRLVSAAREVLHGEILPACDHGRDWCGFSVAVSAPRVTVTLIDEGEGPRAPDDTVLSQSGVTVHRFGILDHHHAVVLEVDDGGGRDCVRGPVSDRIRE